MFPDLSRRSHFSSALASSAGIDGASCRDDPDSRNSDGLSTAGDGPAVSLTMMTTAIHFIAAAGLGGMAGLLGGLFGVGGGFLVIPLLGFFYGMDQQTAQGTALMMVVPNVLWAFSRYQRRFGIDLRMAATIAVSALIATYPTARLATGLDPHILRLAFAVFLATTAGTVAYRTWRGSAGVGRGRRRAWAWVTIVGIIGGVVSGLFGVGGAFIAPPLLTTFFGLRQLEAQGLALALVSPSALLALLAYAEAGQVDWRVGLPLALGGIAAISAGVAFASRLPERRMRLAFCALLLITAVLLALRG
jgi:uncharacterized membrane protein YfcA